MWDVIGTVLTGGATGLIGTVIGKGFSFVDNWQKEKAADKIDKTIDRVENDAKRERDGSSDASCGDWIKASIVFT